MTSLAWLIPVALVMGGFGLAAFLWSLKSGQYDDLEGSAWRAVLDDEPRRGRPPAASGTTTSTATNGETGTTGS